MINKVQMGVASAIRDVLKLTPKKIEFGHLAFGDYFEYLNKIFLCIGVEKAVDQDGFEVRFSPYELVHPVKVSVQYDYVLLKEDGMEMVF